MRDFDIKSKLHKSHSKFSIKMYGNFEILFSWPQQWLHLQKPNQIMYGLNFCCHQLLVFALLPLTKIENKIEIVREHQTNSKKCICWKWIYKWLAIIANIFLYISKSNHLPFMKTIHIPQFTNTYEGVLIVGPEFFFLFNLSI